MKKTFTIAAIVAASLFALTSCDKDAKKCWEIRGEMEGGNISITSLAYVWLSENEIDAYVEKSQKDADALGVKVTYKKKSKSKYKTEADCLAQNPKETEIITQ